MLRAADNTPQSILLIRERHHDLHCNDGAVGTSSAAQPHVFGAFVPTRWSSSRADSFFSDKRCFLFALTPTPSRIFASREEAAMNYVHASASYGIGFGGSLGCFGLRLDPDLTSGECLPSLTFGNC